MANKGQSPQPGKPLRVRVVVTELRKEGEDTLRWVLLTNLKDPISQVVQGYLGRWLVAGSPPGGYPPRAPTDPDVRD